MAATSATPASPDAGATLSTTRGGAAEPPAGTGARSPGAKPRRAVVAVAAAATLIFTNGPVLLFSKRLLDRTSRWEDHAVWPFLVAAAACGAALAVWDRAGAGSRHRAWRRPVAASERIAVIAVGWLALAALASSLWSVDPPATAWRSSIYVGMALLAWAVARLDVQETAALLGAVAGIAVVASLTVVALRPDVGVDSNDHWRGVYTNRNSLAPLAAIGVLASVRFMLTSARRSRAACAAAAAAAAAATLAGAGSRTAWGALSTALAVTALPVIHQRIRRRWGRGRAAAVTLAAAAAAAVGGATTLAVLWDDPTLGQRRAMWGVLWDRIVQRPLGGHGFYAFWDVPELVAHVLLRRGSAHNSLVEVGLGLGLLGAVPFTVIVVGAARNAGLALWRRPGPDTWMWASVVAFLIVENVTESFVLWFSYSWVLLMAAALRPAPAAESAPNAFSGEPDAGPVRRTRTGPTLIERLRRGGNEAGPPADVEPEPPAAAATGGPGAVLARLRSGWTAVALVSLAMLALWIPDLDLPLGNSDEGRIVAFSGLHARNFWDLGPVESLWGARVDPFIRPEFSVSPRSEPGVEAVTYAHHPPLKDFMSTASAGLFGQNLPALRIPAMLMGAATLAFMASLLRACRVRWGPTLLSVGAMACTGFFYVYGRLGVSFSLLLASAAAVAWLLRTPQPPRWALIGTAVVAALAAMQSWIAMAALGPLAAWLLAGRAQAPAYEHATPSGPARRRLRAWLARGWSPALTALLIGASAGMAITAAWMLNATGFTELAEQVGVRVSNETTSGGQATSFTFGEFLSRQWQYASEELLVPGWLRVLLVPALAAGLIDRRTRAPTAITLAAAAALTFGLQHGAWIHRLWNFPWLAPVTIGLASLLDAARRLVPPRLRTAAAATAGAAIAATVLAVAVGGTRDRYISDPAHLGEALEQVAGTPEALRAELVWTGPGLPAPRWASYYLDLPVWDLEESRLDDMVDSDLVIVRASRTPDFYPAGALDDPLASVGDFRVLTAASLSR